MIFAQSDIVTITQSGNSIIIDFDLPDYVLKDTSIYENYGINRTYKYVEIEDFGDITDIGYPELPQLTIDLAVPSNAYNFSISSSNLSTTTTYLSRKIYPAQEGLTDNPVFYENSSYYNTTGSLYAFNSKVSEEFNLMNVKGVSVTIFPFQYNPLQNRLTIIRNGRFTLNYSLSTQLKSSQTVNNPDIVENYLSNVFYNYSPSTLKSGTATVGKYLIITDAKFSSTLSSFVSHKESLGYDVSVVTTSTTGTTSDDIKNYIQGQYDNETTRPHFVLLVGDVGDIPASGGDASSDEGDPLTDLHYARLNGDDYFADVFLGRFSVSTSTTTGNLQLQNIINKVIYMENNLHILNKRAVFLAGEDDSWWPKGRFISKEFERTHKQAIKAFESLGYSCPKVYAFSDDKDQSDALNELDNDPMFFIYSGHGAVTQWGDNFNLGATQINSSARTNSTFPFVFAFACRTGNFGDGTCVGETWIRSDKGGVSYFGSSVITLTNHDKRIAKRLLDEAFKQEFQLGAVTNLGMKMYYNECWALSKDKKKRYMKSYNVLGDPSIFIKKDCQDHLEFFQSITFHNGDAEIYYAKDCIKAPTDNATFILKPNSKVTLLAGNKIVLGPGFKVEKGTQFYAGISNFCFTPTKKSAKIQVVNTEKHESEALINSIEPTVNVFPNPFYNELSFSILNSSAGQSSLEIYNTTGIMIKEANITDKNIFNIATSDLPQGIYIYKISSGTKIYSGKIIKTK